VFAAVGFVCVLKSGIGGGHLAAGQQLSVAAVLAAAALGLDFLQYAYGAILWGVFHRRKEPELGRGSETEFGIDRQANWPTTAFFGFKLLAMIGSWGVLIWCLGR
jgi:hypothetical protein